MPDDDSMLGQNLVDVRNEERRHRGEGALPEADRQRILLARQGTQGFPLSRAERKPVSDRGKRAWVFLGLLCFLAGMLIIVEQARARPPVPPDVFVAVRAHWQERSDRVKAFDVIACETGGRYNTTAANGQYLGIFQMSSWARARYGHGWSARAQAQAAYKYWRESGWAGWSICA